MSAWASTSVVSAALASRSAWSIWRAQVFMNVSEFLGWAVLSPHRSADTRAGVRRDVVAVSKHDAFDGSPGAEEPIQGRLVADQAHGDAARPPHDTAGDEDEAVDE